jgi:L-threonylcarbamoyladenylate synthase
MSKPATARILRGTSRNLALLARQLRAGELVAVPTETVYGLAANALSAAACRKIYRAKRRPATDPLIVHLYSAAELSQVCVPNDAARRLAKAFWPGPLTLVLPKTKAVPDIVTAGRDSVAVRVPSHRLFRRLLKLAGIPIAAPSANPFGYVSPTTAEHVQHGLGTRIRFILDGGATPIGLESTIVDLRDEAHPRLLRPGAVTRRQLEQVLGRRVAVAAHPKKASDARAQLAPGMLTRHYSPRTPVDLHRKLSARAPGAAPDEAFVFVRRPRSVRGDNVFWFDERGTLDAVARALFSTLRRLDHAGFARIHVELAPGAGLADAINDRLRRAAAR